MDQNQNLNPAVPAADTPQPAAKLTPEAIVEQIRAMRSQVDDLTPLDKAQRQQLKQRTRRQPAPVVEASISVISSSGTVAQAVGQPAEDVLQLQSDVARWAMVEAELQSFFEGIEGANLVRRERLAFIASQAYSFGSQLVRNPENVDLLPQVKEMQRRKVAARRKKAQANPQSPSPSPVPPPPHNTSTTPQA
ncbi:MAG TPA: hypothetical protein VGQ65_13605 [Thermoanaerobaculia bacterium]|jgi:hypothetical protein|nr:hypothetical protein [Thermoanaerobaculia bacterium]